MQTIIIRIGDPAEVQGTRCYPVGLYVDDGTEADWATRPRASANVPVALPALPEFPAMDVAAIRAVLRSGQGPADRLMAAGSYLYRLVTTGEVGAALASALAFPGPGGQARSVVFDVRPPELRSLPWELIVAADGTQLFLGEHTLCVRARVPADPAEDVLVPGRVLVVVGNPHQADLRAEDEVDAIQAALRHRPGEWHVVVLRGPSSDALLECLRDLRPHVFHFIGHTGTDPNSQEPVLEFRPTPDGPVRPLSAYKIRHLPRAAVPRLAFLNACRSAEILRPEELAAHHEAAWSVAGAFEQLGAAAVLSMQADIPSGPAVRFTGEVYRQLAEGQPIDAAVRRGREALFQADAAAPRDWALPCLTLRTLPHRVLPIQLGVNRETAERLIVERYRDVPSLVDRTAEHWDLWGGVESEGPPRHTVLVVGPTKVGKSALVRSCLLTWQLRGCQVAYADLHADKRQTWLDAVRTVRDALTDCLPERAREPRRLFDHKLGYLCAGEDPQPLPAAGGRTDPGGRWEPRTEREPELRASVFGALRDMLHEVAGDRPLTLALDHLSAVMDLDVEEELLPRLFVPIGTGNLDPVRIVLVETTESAARLIPDDLARIATVVKVPPFERDQTLLMYREFLARTRRSFAGQWELIANARSLRPEPVWYPGELGLMASALASSEGGSP